MSNAFPPAKTPSPLTGRSLPLPMSKPFWVYVLLAAIGLVFLLELTLPLFVEQLIPYLSPDYAGIQPSDFRGGSTNNYTLILLGANFRPFVIEGQVWRFFTSMFLHIGITHLLFNAYALFIFGLQMERVFGRARFITIYVLSGLFGSLASFSFSGAVISAGASGAIFGIIGMQAAYFYKHKDILGAFGRNSLINVALIAGINLMFGFTQAGIDNMAHIGGLISGALLAYVMLPSYKVVEDYTGPARVIDQSSFWRQIWAPLLAAGLLVVGIFTTVGLG